MKRSEAFPSKYLGKDDVPHPITAVISDVVIETLKGDSGDEDKAVVHFQDDTKPMIVNSGNWLTIEGSYGDESDHWKGKPIEIYVDPSVMFGKKRVGGLRVRIPNGQTRATTPTDHGLPTAAMPPVLARISEVKTGTTKAGAVRFGLILECPGDEAHGHTVGTFDKAAGNSAKIGVNEKAIFRVEYERRGIMYELLKLTKVNADTGEEAEGAVGDEENIPFHHGFHVTAI